MADSSIPFYQSMKFKMFLLSVAPAVIILFFVITYLTLNTFSLIHQRAETNLQTLADEVAAEIERGNSRSILTSQMLALAQEEILFGERSDSVKFAKRTLLDFPEFTALYIGYEPNSDNRDKDFVDLPENDPLSQAHDETGRFLPYWFRNDENQT